MAQVEQILIVGGGIAGLTLATALHQQGLRAELLECSPEWQAVGAGIAVQPNGMRVLDTLGLGSAVEEAGTVIRRWDFCDEAGAVLSATDLEALWGNVGPFIGIARSKLQAVLRKGAAAVPTRLGTSIRSLIQDEQRVQVEFSDGSAGDYDLVVGADGIASTVRALALSAAAPVYAGQVVWRSLAPIRPSGLSRVQFLLGEGCFFGLCPVGEGQTYGFGNVTMPRFHDALRGRLARLRERFSAFGEVVQEYLAALTTDEQVHCSPIAWAEQALWQRGRVVLIGDAAHASSPMMGQGGCLALEDAWVLAVVLREAESVEQALETFVNRRRPRVEWVRQHSLAVAESFALPPALRNATLQERGDQLMYARYAPLKVAT
ncbi:MAG TPA: FAD-dependent monooxygenase [Ktedonobacterales bacterium]|jgi:2-polyprenyl-6-methoxyphenol hydroxylase-like FAD-dependent oxidoreductase